MGILTERNVVQTRKIVILTGRNVVLTKVLIGKAVILTLTKSLKTGIIRIFFRRNSETPCHGPPAAGCFLYVKGA